MGRNFYGKPMSDYEFAVRMGYTGTEAEFEAENPAETEPEAISDEMTCFYPAFFRRWHGYYITAYGIAVKNGFIGTEAEWLESLVGPEGPKGDGLEIIGTYATLEELIEAHPVGEKGDFYRVGSEDDYLIYYWDVENEEWSGIEIRGEQGIQGERGPAGSTGPAGQPGPAGPAGETGPAGPAGADGQDGSDGITPTIGQNGNWYLGETDTGKPSRGEQGETGQTGPAGSDGQDGSDGVSPTLSSNKVGKTTTVYFTDAEHTAPAVLATILDGADGQGSGDMTMAVYDPDARSEPVAFQSDISEFVTEAPTDGKQYARKDGDWTETQSSGGAWGSITGDIADQEDLAEALAGKQPTISDLATIRSGAALGATALQSANDAYLVEYGTTTFAQIDAAIAAGKQPVCYYNGFRYDYVGLSNGYHCFTAVVTDTARRLYVKSTWGNASYTIAKTSDIPSEVTESTVAGWGFTKNTGTYSKPSGGIPKSDMESSVQTSLGLADSALQSYTETDPTVPSWAKQSSKPTYTYTEVGAEQSGAVSTHNASSSAHSSLFGAKLNVSQGAAHAGEFLVVGNDGNITTQAFSVLAGGSY